MSTVCKLDVMVRVRRRKRAALLRYPPYKQDRFGAAVILAELALIHNNSRLTGSQKHELFTRGAKQLVELK